MPWDVPKYNELQEVLFSIHRYKLHSDWVNFRLGLDHSSAENSFLKEVIERNTSGTGCTADNIVSKGYRRVYIGADLGKTSWITIGIDTDAGLRIICAVSITVASLPEQNLGKFLVMLMRQLAGIRSIVDAAPNYETALYMTNNLYDTQAYGAYYGGSKTNILDIYNFNDKEGIVSMDRDASFDDLAKAVNSGLITFCEPTEVVVDKDGNKESVLMKHLCAMKKVKVMTSKGKLATWTNTGPDHFAHALNYCYAAYASVNERFSVGVNVGVSMGKVKLKQEEDHAVIM